MSRFSKHFFWRVEGIDSDGVRLGTAPPSPSPHDRFRDQAEVWRLFDKEEFQKAEKVDARAAKVQKKWATAALEKASKKAEKEKEEAKRRAVLASRSLPTPPPPTRPPPNPPSMAVAGARAALARVENHSVSSLSLGSDPTGTEGRVSIPLQRPAPRANSRVDKEMTGVYKYRTTPDVAAPSGTCPSSTKQH
ncbi:hypothetical protein PG984_002997 [Apiospora sp. TS-2023a]